MATESSDHYTPAKTEDHPMCPVCGKTKRGWRRLWDTTLCSDCEKYQGRAKRHLKG